MESDVSGVVRLVKSWLETNGLAYGEKALAAVALLLVGHFLIKWIVALTKAAMLRTCRGKPLVPGLIASIISKTLWVLLLIVVATQLGISTAPLVAGLSVTGFVVGFACQDSLANLAAGVMIAINEPFTVGDTVTVAGVTGVIHEVSMMATVVRDDTGNRVVVPNKTAWGGVITNRTRKLG